MKPDQLEDLVPPGWVGGLAQSNPAFAYPNPDLSSLPMLKNMDNIHLLERHHGGEWRASSWATQKGQGDPKRCFQMTAPYIPPQGYHTTGRHCAHSRPT